jgi:hypothetical protein
VAIEEELSQRIRQTIRATKLVMMDFFNANELALVNLLPQNTSFTAVYFVDNMIIPLARPHAQQGVTSPIANCTCISTISSATLLGMSETRWPAVDASAFPIHVFTQFVQPRLILVRVVKAAALREIHEK